MAPVFYGLLWASRILIMRSSLGLCNNVIQIFHGFSWASPALRAS